MPILRSSPQEIENLFRPSSEARLHILKVSSVGLECYGEMGLVDFLRPKDCSNEDWGKVISIAIQRLSEDLNKANLTLEKTLKDAPERRCPRCGDFPSEAFSPFCSDRCQRGWRHVD